MAKLKLASVLGGKVAVRCKMYLARQMSWTEA